MIATHMELRIASLENVLMELVSSTDQGIPSRASILSAKMLLSQSLDNGLKNTLMDSLGSIKFEGDDTLVRIDNLAESVLFSHKSSGLTAIELLNNLSCDQGVKRTVGEVKLLDYTTSDIFSFKADGSIIAFFSKAGSLIPVPLSHLSDLYAAPSNVYLNAMLSGNVKFIRAGDFH